MHKPPEALEAAESKLTNKLASEAQQSPSTLKRSALSRRLRFARKWAFLLLLTAILIPVTIFPPYSPAIRSDGVGYHMWTRAILERDLSFCKWSEAPGMLLSSHDVGRGVCRNIYPPGLALLRFPIMAPLVDLRPGAPLISPAEHLASQILGAVALVLVCWSVMASSYLLGVPIWAANVAVLAFTFGTGLFHYGTCDSCFTHIYSALGLSLLVWLWLRSRTKQQPAPWWAFGLICFFLVGHPKYKPDSDPVSASCLRHMAALGITGRSASGHSCPGWCWFGSCHTSGLQLLRHSRIDFFHLRPMDFSV